MIEMKTKMYTGEVDALVLSRLVSSLSIGLHLMVHLFEQRYISPMLSLWAMEINSSLNVE